MNEQIFTCSLCIILLVLSWFLNDFDLQFLHFLQFKTRAFKIFLKIFTYSFYIFFSLKLESSRFSKDFPRSSCISLQFKTIVFQIFKRFLPALSTLLSVRNLQGFSKSFTYRFCFFFISKLDSSRFFEDFDLQFLHFFQSGTKAFQIFGRLLPTVSFFFSQFKTKTFQVF